MGPDHGKPGNGLLLFFRVDDFDMALPRARALVSRLEEEPHLNPSTETMEFSLRDPDGYYVTISAGFFGLATRSIGPLAGGTCVPSPCGRPLVSLSSCES